MEVIENESDSTPVKLLNDEELVSLVIEKHNKYIREFTDELTVLEKKAELDRSEYQRIKNELETLETRIVVLGEKRHQLFHQSRKLRIQLTTSLQDHEGTPVKMMDKIENRLQNTHLTSTEELSNIDQLRSCLEQLATTCQMDSAQQRTMASIIDILETAKAARHELDESINAPDKLKSDHDSLKNEYEEMESRCGWLRRRLLMHKEGLEYWNTAGAEQHE